jgi:protocatechuate 3,4-dioxygenase beta subunit
MTRRAATFAAAIGLLAAASGRAQTPAPADSARGAIRGRITAEGGGPLRRAQVSLVPVVQAVGELRIAASANSQGQYELKDVPPGTYRVRAVRSGYVAAEYGQRLPSQPGQTVEVRAGRVVDRIDIALPRGAVLAGRIVDETGEPFPGVQMGVLELRFTAGRRVPFPGPGATTDDLGEFRITGLRPGTYYLMATTTETWLDDKRQPRGFAATYFPGGSEDNAQTITVGAAQERTDLDFTMLVSRAARISGVVYTSSGAPAAAQPVLLAREYPGASVISTVGARNIPAKPDGSFEFQNVPPGHYLLQSRAGQSLSGQDEVAALHLDVTGEDLDRLVLRRQTGSSVSGTISTDDGTAPDFPATRLRMEPVATDPDRRLPTSIYLPLRNVKPDWTFAIPNIAGPHLFRVTGLPDGWMVKTVRILDQDVTDVPTEVPVGRKDIDGVEVILTRQTGTVSGTVVDRDGAPVPDVTVVVFADDRDRWGLGSRFVRTALPDTGGRFTITGLPGGTYRAFASATAVEGQWEDVEFLAEAHADATRLTVTEGSAQTVTLRVEGAR